MVEEMNKFFLGGGGGLSLINLKNGHRMRLRSSQKKIGVVVEIMDFINLKVLLRVIHSWFILRNFRELKKETANAQQKQH